MTGLLSGMNWRRPGQFRNINILQFLRMVFDEDNGDLVLIMNGRWVVMTKECWQVLLQLFHGGVHMEPAGPTQGSLSLNYQSFEI